MSNDDELIADFVRINYYPDVIVIFVGDVTWSGHEPKMAWIPVIALPIETSPFKVQKQAAAMLQRKRYFAFCQECAQRKPMGWMHDTNLCQSCAENRGYVC